MHQEPQYCPCTSKVLGQIHFSQWWIFQESCRITLVPRSNNQLSQSQKFLFWKESLCVPFLKRKLVYFFSFQLTHKCCPQDIYLYCSNSGDQYHLVALIEFQTWQLCLSNTGETYPWHLPSPWLSLVQKNYDVLSCDWRIYFGFYTLI